MGKRGHAPRPHVVVLECGCGRPEALRAALPDTGFEVVSCATPESLLETSLQRAPDLILYQLGCGPGVDAGVLRLLRRAYPDTPLVVASQEPSLEAQRWVQQFRPISFLVQPIEATELRDVAEAVRAKQGARLRAAAEKGGSS